ncbi:dextranase [Sporothrix schenckii ATCC 58251]|uniref:Dextranase n=1 Tax=Sporothrix schenckii (strain ATCC 58251 / de Perez 2211183) TaxID=1391915 RepID=U7PPJ2_SPOS1|nr:dextranase [Sporothrix schenckii ATCC 58251]
MPSFRTLAAAVLLLVPGCVRGAAVNSNPGNSHAHGGGHGGGKGGGQRNGNVTHCGTDFCTWWHTTGEINTWTPVKPGNVRQSHRYSVEVSPAGANTFYDSFVYEAIPRNGNGRIYAPTDAPYSNTLSATVDDGISIEPSIGLNMAWSQFEYSHDVDVRITTIDGSTLGGAGSVTIRPTADNLAMRDGGDGSVIIRVPAATNGYRFSVEFANDLYSFRSNGSDYVTSGGSVVGVEPTNALVIFASPFLAASDVPSMTAANTHTMTPGPINNGDWGNKSILYFPPGVYYMNQDQSGNVGKLGSNHMRLGSNTYWVHFAPGAYVKGTIEYFTTAAHFYATGHGVLSGENYVYQANAAEDYVAVKSDTTSLRMWWHNNLVRGQTWTCQGPTIAAPPFNTMDFNGNSDVSSRISNYKQVGAFFFQTDGPEIYANSIVHDVFWHVNDDALKIYYSGASVSRATIWKGHNDPVIQMGWTVRSISGVTIDTLNVIHARYSKSETVVPSAIIGASPFYEDGMTVSPNESISMSVSNIVCEGLCPALMRITPLQSYTNFKVTNVSFPDGLQTNSIGIGESLIPAASGVTMDLIISNWTVNGTKVTMSDFGSTDLGQFNIDVSYWGEWEIV